jgi:hypothetical protein
MISSGRRHLAFLRAGFALLASGAACSPPPAPKKLEMEPIGTWKAGTIPMPADDGDGGTTTPNSATPSLLANPCSASEFDDLEESLKLCDVPMPRASEVPSLKDKIEVKATASPSSTTPGGRVAVQVTLRNKTGEPVMLYFTGDPNPHFELEAVDGRGRRVDLPATRWPGYPKGMKPEAREARVTRVTLDRRGVARLKLSWDAVKTRWAPERAKLWDGRGYPRVMAGPLGPGRYSLRLVLPLLGDVDLPTLPVEVRKG